MINWSVLASLSLQITTRNKMLISLGDIIGKRSKNWNRQFIESINIENLILFFFAVTKNASKILLKLVSE